jgi:hypothetical protein
MSMLRKLGIGRPSISVSPMMVRDYAQGFISVTQVYAEIKLIHSTAPTTNSAA